MKLDVDLYRIPWLKKEGELITPRSITEWTEDFFEEYIGNSYIGEMVRDGYEPHIAQFPVGDHATITDLMTIDLTKAIGRIVRLDFDDGVDVKLTDSYLKNYIIGLLETNSVVATGYYLMSMHKINKLANIYLAVKDKNEIKYI